MDRGIFNGISILTLLSNFGDVGSFVEVDALVCFLLVEGFFSHK